jgi:hypothetical protein
MLAVTVTAGADMAIRQGKVLLQNVEDFYAWAKQTDFIVQVRVSQIYLLLLFRIWP